MNGMGFPPWAIWLMLMGFIAFIAIIAVSVRRNHGIRRALFAYPYGLWIAVFTLIPLLLIGYYAFTDKMSAFTLDNFKTFWDSNYEMNKQLAILGYDPGLLGVARGTVNVDTLIYSLWMAFLCTAICLLLGYPAALFMADRDFKLGSTLVILFIIPMWMNFLLRTIAWMSLLEDSGLINSLLALIGLPRARLMYNSQAVLLGMVYNYLPFMVFPVYNALSKQDRRLSEAAMDLGASPLRTFFKINMPLSLPGVVSGITMVFMPSVTTFFIPRVLGGGNTEMFGDLIERTFLSADNWNVGSALSLIMMLLILMSLSLLRKVDPEGEGEHDMMKFIKRGYLAFVLLFLYVPIIVLILQSFNAGVSRAKWEGFSLKWYEALFKDPNIMNALYTTITVALLSASAATVLGTLAAIGINAMQRRPQNVMMTITHIPMTMPDIVTAISLMLLFIFTRVPRGYFTMLLAHITFNIPYVILSVLPKLKQMNRFSYEAALDLGATPGYALRRVILPFVMPGVITGTLLAFTLSLDDFTISYFTTSPLVQNLSTLIYSEARKGIKPTMNALSALMFIALLVLLLAVNRRASKSAQS